jgi:hypothetical protein
MTELKGLLRERTPLYRQAHAVVDTSQGGAEASLAALLAAVGNSNGGNGSAGAR